jgi:four helix bundle protein
MITSFKDLKAWQLSMDIAVGVYELTKNFPNDEQFGLTNQIRRASVSISSNIAEGFGRNNQKEKDQFYGIAYGSLLEVESQLILAVKLGYLTKSSNANELFDVIVEGQKVLSGLKKANKKERRV